ncbi:conserved protein of unknown function [Hyphomicrobium sp. 1Nfss2.1]|uniref:hypothetical protein n=1 Tax=Hyphomicrobium sp. 1Nfss2.1 TaxID=3413936 RepID=UPI003C7B4B2A
MRARSTNQPGDLLNRLRRILSSLHLDCECRETLDGALDRFSNFESRRELRDALAQGRRQRDWIYAQLGFLADLDDITEFEADESVFEEMAMLFDEVGAAARGAAKSIRQAATAKAEDA